MIILLGDLTAYTVANADEISAKAVAQGTMTEEIRQGINENVSWYYDVSEEQKRVANVRPRLSCDAADAFCKKIEAMILWRCLVLKQKLFASYLILRII